MIKTRAYTISILTLICVAGSLIATSAQVEGSYTPSEFDQPYELADSTTDAQYRANVRVTPDDSAAEALRLIVEQNVDEKSGEPNAATVQGYRIGIFFDNSASARARATEVVQRCDSLLGDLQTTMSYDNPYFKVSTGYTISQEEAVMQLHRVQRYFPRAYLMRESVTPQNIVAARNAELAEQARRDSLTLYSIK
ncbi:MAG: hypothetical protein R3Y68_00415 [Rikenellaceae bacterium]